MKNWIMFFIVFNLQAAQNCKNVYITINLTEVANASYVISYSDVLFDNNRPSRCVVAEYYTFDGKFLEKKRFLNFQSAYKALDYDAPKPQPTQCYLIDVKWVGYCGFTQNVSTPYFLVFMDKNNKKICACGCEEISIEMISEISTNNIFAAAFIRPKDAKLSDLLDLSCIEKLIVKDFTPRFFSGAYQLFGM